MDHARFSLSDKYTKQSGTVFLTGIEALVRLALDQARRDRTAGHRTAGFISGYRGSPLGGLDQRLWQEQKRLDEFDITFTPGVNEELAATAVWGTQQIGMHTQDRVEGVFGMWYGKAPGVDRTGDAFRHANFSGTSPLGGALVIAGDDHTCKSSTVACQSEFALMDVEIPVLSPSNIQEVLDYGLYGWALSRYSGLWVSLIALADTMDSAATITVGSERHNFILPTDFDMPPGGLHIRGHDAAIAKEIRLRDHKLPAVAAFTRANPIDRVTLRAPRPRLGIVASGKAFQDLAQTMESLGLSDSQAADLGISIYKVAMPWPLERSGALEFAQGLETLLVLEHKRPLIETQLKDYLYDLPDSRRPKIIGKSNGQGQPILPSTQELTLQDIGQALISLLPVDDQTDSLKAYLTRITEQKTFLNSLEAGPTRAPFYCSGCPHNRSTRTPDGSRTLAGIGCHFMATMMDRNTDMSSQMGGEGAMWIGQQNFTHEKHVFANLGDGTYFHSGILAVRAAVAAKARITYKLLFNDAVAMTGGQPVDGLTVPQITRQLAAEGVARIAVVSEDPGRYDGPCDMAPGVSIDHRDHFDTVQNELRDYPGVSVLIFDQTCAAEKRRRRKQGLLPDPKKYVFINEQVCEGCGDCSVKSNCLSVEPVETKLGRKRHINQSSCNKDYSCLDGFCPSFVTIEGERRRQERTPTHEALAREVDAALKDLPVPQPPSLRLADAPPTNIILAGVGGSGISTISAILGTAAHIDGQASAIMNMTGLAQKGGTVISHLRIADTHARIHGARVPTVSADLLLGFDLVVSAENPILEFTDRARTTAIFNPHLVPTADFVENNDIKYDQQAMQNIIEKSCRDFIPFDATQVINSFMGDTLYANIALLGFAVQKGVIPISLDALIQAITLNGRDVDQNLFALSLGRVLSHDASLLHRAIPRPETQTPDTLEDLIIHRKELLTAYQDTDYAERYHALITKVAKAETRIRPTSTEMAQTVARAYYKVLSYKDEYEVARLYTDGHFSRALAKHYAPDTRIKVYLAPPLFSKINPDTGQPMKRAFGSWIFTLFKQLAKLKVLRGSRFDPFGYLAERRMERQLITDYERDILQLVDHLSSDNMDIAISIAELPLGIKGFGHVKLKNVEVAQAKSAELWDRFKAPQPAQHAA